MKKLAVFVGTEPAQYVPAEVLRHSIQSFNSEIDVFFICDLAQPVDLRGRTPFSFQRLMIPAYCADYENAIYMDSDMLVFSDLSVILDEAPSMPGVYGVLQPPGVRHNQSSFLLFRQPAKLFDPGAIIESFSNGRLNISYTDLIEHFAFLADGIHYCLDSRWNSLECRCERTSVLHYTDMETQPWLYAAHPLGMSWISSLVDSIRENSILEKQVIQDVSAGFLRPSLINDIEYFKCHSKKNRFYINQDLTWYPPGLIPTIRPRLWGLMRSSIMPLRWITCLGVRSAKFLLSKRERRCILNLVFTSNKPSSLVHLGTGIFDSYN